MKAMIKTGVTLALIAAIAATALALINSVTAPRIAAYDAQVIQNTLAQVAGGFTVGEAQESDNVSVSALYALTDENGQNAGYILSLIGNGYGGAMTIMASYSPQGALLDARLLNNAETPGLGKKAENPEYMEKYTNKDSIPLKKSELSSAEADSIGGSTVTFSGIAKTLAYGSEYVMGLGGK
ncbi:MAG: FMN-binding protein [Sphaerochaetaceae bacterium]|nr:FMN-binding protein [Sphaerochaetaceae bacterium]